MRTLVKLGLSAALVSTLAGCSWLPSMPSWASPSSWWSSDKPAARPVEGKPGPAASRTPPRMVRYDGVVVWDNPAAFGPVPAALMPLGNKTCSALNTRQLEFGPTGYHPLAVDLNGKPFSDGGFYCTVVADASRPKAAPAATVAQTAPAAPVVVAPAAPPPPPPAPAPVAKAAPTLQEKVEVRLAEWRDFWIDRNPDAYLALYDRSFPDLQKYSDNRRRRMQAATFIELEIENIRYRQVSPTEAVVRFVQTYRSNTFKDKVIKELVWRDSGDGPKIVEERFIK